MKQGVKGRVVTVVWRCVGAAALLACALSVLPAFAATPDTDVTAAEQRLSQARTREAALSVALDAAAEAYERAQAHHLRLQEELREVERESGRLRSRQTAARASLQRRVTAAYRAPYTDLALATAVLDAPDAVTALRRADLMARLTVHAAHEVTDIREAEVRQLAGLRQRRIIAAGTSGAAQAQSEQAERLTAALSQAAGEVREAEQAVEDARARQAAAVARAREAAARTPLSAAAPLPPVDGKVCPVAGPHGFIDSWGFPRSGGRRHQGVDMFAAYGTPLAAVADGTVRRVYVNRLGGLSIDLVDTNGDRYYYAHLASASAQNGQAVRAGDVIGTVGQSGNARGTPPHLHWQYHPDGGAPVNPYPLARTLCR